MVTAVARTGDTYTPASSTPPAPSQGYPCASAGHPPPRPCLRRSSPAPSRGRGPCVAISGEQPCPALLQDLPMLWTVWISPRGVGLTGRGNLFPLPCLPHSNHLTSCRHPWPAPSCRLSIHFCRHPHPARAFGRGYPCTSAGGRVCARAYIRGAAVSGSSPGSPHAVDRVDIATGGGADGEEELVPPPLSPTLQPPYVLASPAPPLPGDNARAYIWWEVILEEQCWRRFAGRDKPGPGSSPASTRPRLTQKSMRGLPAPPP